MKMLLDGRTAGLTEKQKAGKVPLLPDALEQLQVDHWKKLSYSRWNPETKDLWLDFLFPSSYFRLGSI